MNIQKNTQEKRNFQVVEKNSSYNINYNCSIPTSLDLNSFVQNEDTFFIDFYNSHLPKKLLDFLIELRNRTTEVRRSEKERFVTQIMPPSSNNISYYYFIKK